MAHRLLLQGGAALASALNDEAMTAIASWRKSAA